MPRPRDIARKSVRVDMRDIDADRAQKLLDEYGHVAAMIAGDFPGLEFDEMEAIGRVAILEGAVTHNETRIPIKAWITQVIRWRIRERAAVELGRPEIAMDPPPEARTNGRHDPERTFQLDQVIELLPYLPPRQAVIIDGRLRRETFAEIGLTLGISGQWCHQEYHTAITTLRGMLGFRP